MDNYKYKDTYPVSDAEGGEHLWSEWSSKSLHAVRVSVYVPPGTTKKEKREMLKYPGFTVGAIRHCFKNNIDPQTLTNE